MSIPTQFPAEIQEATGCVRRTEKVTRSHMFSIVGYTLDKNIGKGKILESNIFYVGGHDWCIKYYPNGSTDAGDDDISIFLYHTTKSEGIKAQFSFTIIDQSGCALPFSRKTTAMRNFDTFDSNWGYQSFCKRAELESKITDDCFVIKSVVTVFKEFPVEPTPQIVVPPGNILQQLSHLLDSGVGTNVTFKVDEQTFSAHKCILAARSPVFLAQFFGAMKEKSDKTIEIKEMEAPTFKALLHFIYTDTFSGFEEIKESNEKNNPKLMCQHLLVAADRYGLERLKLICEKMLCGSIHPNNVVTLFAFAERHSCNHLKTTCLKFLSSPGILKELQQLSNFNF